MLRSVHHRAALYVHVPAYDLAPGYDSNVLYTRQYGTFIEI